MPRWRTAGRSAAGFPLIGNRCLGPTVFLT
jgi:hypothetical protein